MAGPSTPPVPPGSSASGVSSLTLPLLLAILLVLLLLAIQLVLLLLTILLVLLLLAILLVLLLLLLLTLLLLSLLAHPGQLVPKTLALLLLQADMGLDI